MPNPLTYRKIGLVLTCMGGNWQMETEQISLDDILSIESDDPMVQALSNAIGFHHCKRDPSGSRFYYLAQMEAEIRPIAVGLFDELKGNDKQALKDKLTDRNDALYREIYSHYLNRQLDQQPALYILLPKDHKRGLVALIKPTDSGLKVRAQLLLETGERDAAVKLNLLRTKCPIRIGSLVNTPNVDHLFYDPVDTAADLAKELARITRKLEQVIIQLYKNEQEDDFLHQLHKSFKAELLPHLKLTSDDPKEYGFADLYAQTVSYGMFTGRCFKPTQAFERRAVSKWNIPPTNPFLKNLFESISDDTQSSPSRKVFYAPLFELIEDLVGCLSSTDMEAILADFSYDKTHHEDIVIHFYETFLKEYNPRQREIRGVYYTPYPVVSYIVRSVDIILKDKFNKPLGLADPEVLILDPATGTGTFLFAIFKHLEDFFKIQVDKTEAITWDDFVDINILPRLFGFELMMAPYSVAHLRMGVELQESGYAFRDDTQRLGVYLTNTLDETAKKSETFFEEFIASESNEAAEIKREKPIMVIMGNPPYSGHSANNGEWISKLMRGTDTLTPGNPKTENYFEVDGQSLGERNPKWINNDYVKFLRFAQWRIDKTGQGVVAFITSNSYIESPTFRGVRESFLKSFDELFILDLHGNSNKQEKCLDGSKDENVFDITEGVAICFLIKTGKNSKNVLGQVYQYDLLGVREHPQAGKYRWLIQNDLTSTSWASPVLKSPGYYFIPLGLNAQSVEEDYEQGIKLTEIFPLNNVGIITKRDGFCIKLSKDEIWKTVNEFVRLSPEAAKERFSLPDDVRDWRIDWAQKDLNENPLSQQNIVRIEYRPFDYRYTYYTGKSRGFIGWPFEKIMRHMRKGNNIALCASRGVEVNKGWQHIFCTKNLIQHHTVTIKEVNYILPLYLEPDPTNLLELGSNERKPNINNVVVDMISADLGLSWQVEGCGDLESTFGPEAVFGYVYAVFHSPAYRTRYDEFLRRDFPKVPFSTNKDLFRELATMGGTLASCHTLEAELTLNSSFPIEGSNNVEQVLFTPNQSRVWINDTQYFEGISEATWEFTIGGQQVCEKWLKDRKKAGQSLSGEDVLHYRRIVASLQETIRLMGEIDEVIEAHGGWPIR